MNKWDSRQTCNIDIIQFCQYINSSIYPIGGRSVLSVIYCKQTFKTISNAKLFRNNVFVIRSLSGLSPFMGDSDLETMANVTRAEFDFDDESFDVISDDAKDFISHLLVKDRE